MNLAATTDEKKYIQEVLDCFKVAMPEATNEQRQALAEKTLFQMRLWDVIYRFRKQNYNIKDVLEAGFIDT